MTVTYSVAGENVVNATRQTGEPAIRLVGNDIVFTNTERGRVVSSSATAAALTIEGQGSRVVNEAEGAILAFDYTAVAITGSPFADVIDNTGVISGSVRLGAGNDRYIDRGDGRFYLNDLFLEEGDDYLEANSQQSGLMSVIADGGSGEDTFVIRTNQGEISGGRVKNFENLIIDTDVVIISGSSDFKSIIFLPQSNPDNFSSAYFLSADNPGVDFALPAGNNSFTIGGASRFANLTAGAGNDYVSLFSFGGTNLVSSGTVLLGGADDTFNLTISGGGSITIVGGVNAGSGNDSLRYLTSGKTTLDASKFAGFEYFTADFLSGYDPEARSSSSRVIGLNGYLSVLSDGPSIELVIADSNSPSGVASATDRGSLVFESNTTFGYYGSFGPPPYLEDIERGDPRQGGSFVNNGRVINGVYFGIGDDIYDGRLGSVGGRIYGYAGNDILRAGVDGSWIDGGFGADDLYGNSGSDTLIGGGGGDILSGGTGVDSLTGGTGVDVFRGTAAELRGDTITDLELGDRITFLGASLGGATPFTFSRSGNTLTFSGGSLTLQNLNVSVRLTATANTVDGGVDLTLQRAASVRNDFNGDGRVDLLWRNSNGQLSQWLGNNNGSFSGNGGVVNQNVSLDWKIAGTADFNGDGFSDILWRNTNGQLSQWLGTANGGFTSNGGIVNQNVPLDWKIAGTVDFNGDGFSDILWRNTNGQLSQWLGTANGGFTGNGGIVNQTVGNDWKIAGTADFNGDGRADILWRNDNGQLSQWLGTANGGFTGNGGIVNQTVGNDWKIAGTADFNGDGFSDILWRNTNGQLSQWLGAANGGFTGNGSIVNQFVANAWKIQGTGDFNGDGRADIMWRNVSGQLSEWLGTADGGFIDNGENVNQIVPNAWAIHIQDYQLV
jgi:Ca2+-binding RTX toxin-like protein